LFLYEFVHQLAPEARRVPQGQWHPGWPGRVLFREQRLQATGWSMCLAVTANQQSMSIPGKQLDNHRIILVKLTSNLLA
jgi:hypothetical protein